MMLLPTAVHAFSDTHDTPLRALSVAPTALGVGWISQLVPSQCSTSATTEQHDSVSEPTAVQSVGDEHDTSTRPAFVAPGGSGDCWSDQLVPFQRAATGMLLMDPTAVQAVGDAHDTPFSSTLFAPDGKGVGWTDHLVPSQRSTRTDPVPEIPTAVHAVGEVHETAHSVPESDGLRWTDQRVPSQLSTRVIGPSVAVAV